MKIIIMHCVKNNACYSGFRVDLPWGKEAANTEQIIGWMQKKTKFVFIWMLTSNILEFNKMI